MCTSEGALAERRPPGALWHDAIGRQFHRKSCWSDALASLLFNSLGAAIVERLEFDQLFRWFVSIGVDDAGGDH